jgi:hypothetical protein
MPETTLLAALLLLSAAVFQQPSTPPRPEYHRSNPTTPHYDPNEIHVDKDCHILPNPSENHTNLKATPYSDPTICHIENQHTSTHEEEKTEDSTIQHSIVTVSEQDFLLHNATNNALSFVIEQLVPRDWQVDPAHPATQVVGSIALYRIHALPGQTLRLHVALRHIKFKKTKSSLTPTAQ